jgi:hypothetical protein
MNAQTGRSGGIDFAKTFGQQSNNVGGNGTDKQDLPKAQIWMNVGYVVETGNEESPTMFVSLPVGLPIDTMEAIPVTSRNAGFAQFQSARNNLLAQVQAAAATLAPGEERIIGGESDGLAIQLRRVNEPVADPGAKDNGFVRELNLVG